MKHYLSTVFTLATIALLAATIAQADNDQKMVIALQTDHFELAETDISDMVVGEAKTIETESGKVIDILRTADGAEIYIDGELLEMDFEGNGLHEEHINGKHIEIICDEDEDCDKHVVIHADGDGDEIDIEELHREHVDGESHKVIVIKKSADSGN